MNSSSGICFPRGVSEEGQGVIRAEFLGRPGGAVKVITFHDASAVATLSARRFVGLVAARWLSHRHRFLAPAVHCVPGSVGSILKSIVLVLCMAVFLVALIAVLITDYQLFRRLQVESHPASAHPGMCLCMPHVPVC